MAQYTSNPLMIRQAGKKMNPGIPDTLPATTLRTALIIDGNSLTQTTTFEANLIREITKKLTAKYTMPLLSYYTSIESGKCLDHELSSALKSLGYTTSLYDIDESDPALKIGKPYLSGSVISPITLAITEAATTFDHIIILTNNHYLSQAITAARTKGAEISLLTYKGHSICDDTTPSHMIYLENLIGKNDTLFNHGESQPGRTSAKRPPMKH